MYIGEIISKLSYAPGLASGRLSAPKCRKEGGAELQFAFLTLISIGHQKVVQNKLNTGRSRAVHVLKTKRIVKGMLTDENKRLAANKFGLNCGIRYFGVKSNGYKFYSKLIEVIGDTLIFETRSGAKYFNNISEIKYLEPYNPQPYNPRITTENNEVV
jgi:hypothetical protein